MTHLFWLSDDAWAAIEPHLPQGKPGKPRVDDRRVISGILHVLKTGCRWRDCPSKYGPLADDRGRPVAFALTPGNVADITMAIPLLGAVDKPKRLLADKAYDADSFRHWLKRRKIKAVIPSTATRRTPYPLDRKIYRRRNVIERMFCKLKNWRRIATRYDRHAQNYLSGLALAAP